MCQETNCSDENEVFAFLKKGTVVGMLPVPHPIFVRPFQYGDSFAYWFASYAWGVIFLKHMTPLPAVWIGTKVNLFLVKSTE